MYARKTDMKTVKKDENTSGAFLKRIDELAFRARSGEICSTPFLTPEECMCALKYLATIKAGISYKADGGYEDAERRVVIIYPDYIPDDALPTDDYLAAVDITTSGYVKLEHRSFLGSLTALGIDRSAIGDILVTDSGATVMLTPPIAAFLLSSEAPLERVGADKVSVGRSDMKKIAEYKRSFDTLSITVVSARVDCVVAELCKLSRERAKEVVSRGEVSLNHSDDVESSDKVEVGDTLSVRRYGKFRIGEITTTRKERLRISVLVYS